LPQPLDSNAGFGSPRLRVINALEINWNPDIGLPCTRCLGGLRDRPVAGSYASTLLHYERVIGEPLPEPRTRMRCLFVFQSPRPNPNRFRACPPEQDPATLEGDLHRYFCLSPAAWRNLRLDALTGSDVPKWPSEENAHHYLTRYFKGGPWSFDAFIAYFLYLFRPESAYITNLAKCDFGKEGQTDDVYKTCSENFLRREIEDVAPNVVLSFTSKVQSQKDLFKWCRYSLGEIEAVLGFYNPGYQRWTTPERTRGKFDDEMQTNGRALERLGCDVANLRETWHRHVGRVLQ
jgi:hypothetical protein